jgi:glycosyltransferase involved in cell wall biosynthesis
MPWPLDDGGRIGLWQSVWSCAREWDVTLVSMVTPGEERLPVPPAPQELGIEVIRVPHRPPPTPVAALQGVFGRWPYTLARYRSPALDRELRRLVSERVPQFVWLNHLHVATGLDAIRGTAVVLREHNVEYVWLERYAAEVRSLPIRTYAVDQARRMRGVEARLCAGSDLVLATQDIERDQLRQLAPDVRVETLPVGIDFARFRPRAPEDPPIVLLAASFGWAPNQEGARRFLAAGWPRLHARMPRARLRVVGKDLPPDLADQARAAGAEAVGYVRDMEDEFARARLLLVPVWFGGGVRVKVVEALAAGLPVVSTPLGAEGLGLDPGRDFIEAESPERLADVTADLLLDPARADAIASSGNEVARRTFSIEEVARLGNGLIGEVLGQRASAAFGAHRR